MHVQVASVLATAAAANLLPSGHELGYGAQMFAPLYPCALLVGAWLSSAAPTTPPSSSIAVPAFAAGSADLAQAQKDSLCFWRGDAALQAGDPAGALSALQALDNKWPLVRDEIDSRRALALTRLGRLAEAQAAWLAVLHGPVSAVLREQAHIEIARLLVRLELPQAAQAALHTALREHPQAPWRAEAQLALADLLPPGAPAAAALFALSVDASPTVAQAAQRRLAALRKQWPMLQPTADERLALLPALLKRRDLGDASAQLLALRPMAAQLLPEQLRLLAEHEAMYLWRTKQYPQARDAYLALLQAEDRGHTSAQMAAHLGGVYQAMDLPQQAVEAFGRAARTAHSSAQRREWAYKAALTAHYAGAYAQAQTLLQTWLKANKRDRRADEALWYLGWGAYHLRDLPFAEHSFRTLLRHRNSSLVPRAQYWLGRLLQQKGDSQAAAKCFAAAAKTPRNYYALAAAAQLPQKEPTSAGLHASIAPSPVDTQYAALHWTSPAGKRAAALLQLGLHAATAAQLHLVPAAHHTPAAHAQLARAELWLALGHIDKSAREAERALASLPAHATGLSLRALQLAYPLAYADLVEKAAATHHVPKQLLLAIMRQESAFAPSARSTSNAHGLMQILPVTGQRIAERLQDDTYRLEQLDAPEVNVAYGAWYLSALLQNFSGSVALAIGGYNAGPHALERWLGAQPVASLDVFLEDVPYRETRLYIKKVLANLVVYERLYGAERMQIELQRVPGVSHAVDF